MLNLLIYGVGGVGREPWQSSARGGTASADSPTAVEVDTRRSDRRGHVPSTSPPVWAAAG